MNFFLLKDSCEEIVALIPWKSNTFVFNPLVKIKMIISFYPRLMKVTNSLHLVLCMFIAISMVELIVGANVVIYPCSF